jgi:hypothetical protein
MVEGIDDVVFVAWSSGSHSGADVGQCQCRHELRSMLTNGHLYLDVAPQRRCEEVDW